MEGARSLYMWLALLLAGVVVVVWACATQNANSDLRGQLKEAQQELAAQQTEVARLTDALSGKEASASNLKADLAAAQGQATKLEEELSRLEQALSGEREKTSLLASQLAQAQEEGRQLSRQIAEMQAQLGTPTPPTPTPTATPTATPTPAPVPDAISRARRAVVLIKSSAGEGSGFIFDPEGLVLTNAHVVGDDPWVTVVTGDAVPVLGEVVGRHLPMDVAVIQLRTQEQMPALVLGDSSLATPGEELLFMGYRRGSPLGQGATITTGVLYAQRQVEGVAHLQIDAFLDPGNSGGPLVNSKGEAMGIYTHRLFQPGIVQANGVAFAIGINPVKQVIPSLSAGAMTPTPTATPAPIRWTLYQNVAWGYTMQLPPGWTADETKPDDVLLWAPGRMAGGEVFSLLAGDYTLESWTDFVLGAVRSRSTAFEEVSRRPWFLPGGWPAMSVLYTASFPGQEEPLKVRLFTTMVSNRNFAVQAHAWESAWEEYGPVLETMGSSFIPMR